MTLRTLRAACLTWLCLTGCQRRGSAPGAEGRLERHAGGSVELASLRGKVVVLNFWATWCGPCVAEIPELVAVAQRLEPRGMVLLAVNQDSGEPAQAHDAVEEFFFTHPSGLRPYVVYPAEGFATQFQVQGLPTTVVLDRRGRATKRFVGGVRAADLTAAVEAAAGGP